MKNTIQSAPQSHFSASRLLQAGEVIDRGQLSYLQRFELDDFVLRGLATRDITAAGYTVWKAVGFEGSK